ncbi:MAG: hypothetical protein PVJ89_09670 [Planctomycetota bacterium]
MDGSPQREYGARDATGLQVAAQAAVDLAGFAADGDRDGLERELLRSLVELGVARAAGLWARPTPEAPWTRQRGFGGETPAPAKANPGTLSLALHLDEHRCVVVTTSPLVREADLDAAEALVATAALLSEGAPATPAPLPRRDPDPDPDRASDRD